MCVALAISPCASVADVGSGVVVRMGREFVAMDRRRLKRGSSLSAWEAIVVKIGGVFLAVLEAEGLKSREIKVEMEMELGWSYARFFGVELDAKTWELPFTLVSPPTLFVIDISQLTKIIK